MALTFPHLSRRATVSFVVTFAVASLLVLYLYAPDRPPHHVLDLFLPRPPPPHHHPGHHPPHEPPHSPHSPRPPADFDEDIPLLPDAAFPGHVVPSPGREIDVTDSFSDFIRFPDSCYLSSLELHFPFSPLCPDVQSFLDAATGGGRAGIDMPFMPRGCDMRWFNTEEMCEILSRFDHIFIIGDSMMRHLAVAIHTLLRKDLYDGPMAQWVKQPKDVDCHCEGAFEHGGCLFYVAFSSKSVHDHVPPNSSSAIHCPRAGTARITYLPEVKYPIEDGGMVPSLAPHLAKNKPRKPYAFILGQGLWNNLNETAAGLWIDQIEGTVNSTSPWMPEGDIYPRLFVTPSASGDHKPVKYQEKQGNIALHRFEKNMGPYLRARGIDHLGMYNATLQNTTPDGTHAGMRANFLKAMFVMNWMSFLDTSRHSSSPDTSKMEPNSPVSSSPGIKTSDVSSVDISTHNNQDTR